jgi:hypothetical protein
LQTPPVRIVGDDRKNSQVRFRYITPSARNVTPKWTVLSNSTFREHDDDTTIPAQREALMRGAKTKTKNGPPAVMDNKPTPVDSAQSEEASEETANIHWLKKFFWLGVVPAVCLITMTDLHSCLDKSKASPSDILPEWILSPKNPTTADFALIEVWKKSAMIHIGSDSFRVKGEPVIEFDEFSIPHMVSFAGDLVCVSDNMVRGHLTLTRAENFNAEYRVEISRPGRADIDELFVQNR